ncbi:hypothetical protein HRW23_19590 [Streptomyces lunaelactis]|uniref:hypothetical protein n=1 Tax=Streptomyces lunaelactis TaxID=1535768 RepID=UPI00158508EE|nr:hypothetical protein [Streptomyces lunaelactis]NUK05505.1 hypothetical protein [Streptomyces lunaelactis]NUK12184.1 hypothetical protein [Streptomyces lunaelactis]NUK19897.1 hypothetical protein [Streptomyces lunaelactis]NUK38420.1 hypothetical protein [Streptomyces lunaelactis]NUK45515.1 hypothetical protein [Streptomyces lunaelactis]
MEAAILILALLFVALVALGVYVTVKVVGAAKRGVERTVTQARRTVEETTLRAKSYGQGGVVGELAQLRLALRTSMRATQDALHAGVAEDASLSESLALFRRLSGHGRELDDELKRLEREPDRATVASLLPGLRERTERITHSAESLRWAARDRARKFADDDLDALSDQIDVEAGALRHWSAADVPDGEPASWPEAGRTAGGAGASEVPAEQTWPEQGAASEAEPQAITARDARQQTTYPWQKSARPETTN